MKRAAEIANAWLDKELTMRVGVPHFSGTLPSHCSEMDYPVMVSAGAFWKKDRSQFMEPGRFGWSTDACNVALDSAGFVAMKHWAQHGDQKGMGQIYPWSLRQYLALVSDVSPRWYSAPDACVEPAVAPDEAAVRHRMRLTTQLLEDCLVMSSAISRQSQGYFRPPVPVLQGWTASHYQESLERTLSTWDLFTTGSGFETTPTLIGVGSVCRRDLHHKQHGLWTVLESIARRIPATSRLHLFGVKGEALPDIAKHFPMVASVDSMAWDFGARMAACKASQSNTMAHRIGHLDRWISRNGATPAHSELQSSLFD